MLVWSDLMYELPQEQEYENAKSAPKQFKRTP